MGWEGGLIALGIVLVIVSFYGNQLSSFVTTYQTNAQNAYVASTNTKTLAPNTSNPGTVVCDLHVIFKPVIDEQAFYSISSNQWVINNGASYNWFNCNVVAGKLTTASLIPQIDNFYYQIGSSAKKKLDLISLGQTIHFNLIVTGADGSVKSFQTDPFLTQSYTLPAGTYSTPLQVPEFDFVIYNIPRQPYVIQVTSDIPINGNPVGQPYLQTINP